MFISSFANSLVLIVYSNISKLQSSSTSMLAKALSNYAKGCKWWWHFNNMRYKDLLSYSSTIETPCSLPINEDTKQKLLNLRSNIKESILWVFFFSNFLNKERKNSNTTQISFLMLDAKEINTSTIIDSSSIKFCKKGRTLGASLSFKTMHIVEFRTSLNN